MTEEPAPITEREPLVFHRRPDDPETDPLRIEVTVHPAPGEAEDEAELSHNRWAVDQSDEHVNPKWDEWFEVVAGEYRVVVDGTTTTLTEGDDIVLPAGVPHRHWNPDGRPARIRYEARPGRRGAELFETLYALAQDGQTNEDGLPNPLRFAVMQDAYSGYFYTTDLPRSLQRVMFGVLSPVGRLAGYEATYSREGGDDQR